MSPDRGFRGLSAGRAGRGPGRFGLEMGSQGRGAGGGGRVEMGELERSPSHTGAHPTTAPPDWAPLYLYWWSTENGIRFL